MAEPSSTRTTSEPKPDVVDQLLHGALAKLREARVEAMARGELAAGTARIGLAVGAVMDAIDFRGRS